MRRALEPQGLGTMAWASEFPSRWTLDRVRNVASLDRSTEALKALVIPLQPLGCIAVAPPDDWSIRTRDSGRFGGNMAYNQIREGHDAVPARLPPGRFVLSRRPARRPG